MSDRYNVGCNFVTYFVQMTSLLLSFVILILTIYIRPTSLNLTIGLSLGKKYVTKSYLKHLALDLGTLNVFH